MANNQRIARQIGSAIRRIRIERGAQQRDVAILAGIPKRLLSGYERGEQVPSFPTLAKVLSTLGCPPEEFSRYFGPWASVETIQRHKL